MPETTKTESTPGGHTVDLEALTQTEASWLLSRSAPWLRGQSLDGRRPDGSYHAQKLVAAYVEQERSKLPTHKLADVEVNALDQSLGYFDLYNGRLAVDLMDRIKQEHGAAGMAAVAELVLESIREQVEKHPEPGDVSTHTPKSEAEIRAEVEAKAERDIKQRLRAEKERDARQKGRVVDKCPRCSRVRWARKWAKRAVPPGHVFDERECDDCYAESALRRMAITEGTL
ncbi:hypothetical protein KOR34_07700 [Posidoniimonas corsicana]|uniref:Uncharacterized protein n=1 Tax=Posidoniimonas corsicana TaxID=1938618 RepID=A0A5C5VB72_9BACT|nr:hypothetical protein [Posidoniimonas corsicana]TWT35874.1 hypothetical protein KOR34_07700 [Posidoniimonas corsicana]